MTTYFKDFPVSKIIPHPRALDYSIRYAALRNALGHNVRRVKLVEEDRTVYRVYFSPGPLDIAGAVEA